MPDDLIARGRALARAEHDDLSVAQEAADEIERLRSAITAFKRFGKHCEERQITIPLWAALLWEEAIKEVMEPLDPAR